MQEWGAGWGGPPCLGAPGHHHPLGSQAKPSQPLGAPGLFHRAGGEEGGRREPLEPSPKLGLGAGGLRLARPLPGTQGL